MAGVSQPDFKETALSEDLLSTPFHIQTKWCVITGASCSGKTTLIKMLAGNGFRTVPEAGRKYFERELAKGRVIEEIRADPAAYLESWIYRDYRALGYKVIRVPVLSPEERLEFVLKMLSEYGLT